MAACPCSEGVPGDWEGPLRDCPIHGLVGRLKPCPDCAGSGRTGNHVTGEVECGMCSGSGSVPPCDWTCDGDGGCDESCLPEHDGGCPSSCRRCALFGN